MSRKTRAAVQYMMTIITSNLDKKVQRRLSVIVSVWLLLFSNSCTSSSFSQNQMSLPLKISNTPEIQKADQMSLVLWGSISFKDLANDDRTTLRITPEKELIKYNQDRGMNIQLPAVGSAVEMDVMNCSEYLGTVKVTYTGEQQGTWKAETFPESSQDALEEKMLQCVDDPNDSFKRKYLSNQIYLISPSDTKRKTVKNIKNPDWNTIIQEIPYEWLKVAELPKKIDPKKSREYFENWLDSDGDGKIDIFNIRAVNRNSYTESNRPYQYQRTLQRNNNGTWRQIWVGFDSKD